MFKNILIGLAVVIVVLVVIVSMQPNTFQVTRTISIKAPPATIFAQVNDLHLWTGWSPWEKLDPALQRTYEGAPSGTGAIYRWNSAKNEVGQGAMTITDSRPGELVGIRLDFLKPFAATNDVAFTFKPEGDETAVTWTMTGQANFMCKAMHLVMNMDKMIGGDFEKGLTSLKAVTEAGTR